MDKSQDPGSGIKHPRTARNTSSYPPTRSSCRRWSSFRSRTRVEQKITLIPSCCSLILCLLHYLSLQLIGPLLLVANSEFSCFRPQTCIFVNLSLHIAISNLVVSYQVETQGLQGMEIFSSFVPSV
jgi:hypothetical protein